MQIITLWSVAREGGEGLCQGTGYVFRFGLNSTEIFFKRGLPSITHQLDIDIRQIMRLELLSDGYRPGLNFVHMCIFPKRSMYAGAN